MATPGLLARATTWTRRSRRIVGRVTNVIRRRRLDGRLPEPTVRLIRDVVRYRSIMLRARVTRSIGRSAGPLRLAPHDPPPGTWRRWPTSGVLDQPLSEFAHRLAGEVIEALDAAGLEPVLVSCDHRVHLAVDAEHRGRALDSLATLEPCDAWLLRWRRGHHWRVHRVTSRRARRARLAETWHVFRCVEISDQLVAGPGEAVEVSFWTTGPEGRRERLGVRGLARFESDSPATVEVVDGHRYRGNAAFPVARALTRMRGPIDVVYTWVDGDDPEWRAEFDHWRRIERPDDRRDHSAHEARYTSRDELRYSLRSLWMFAPWVRHVYVVTADQRPAWLVDDDRLSVVSHRDILPPDALPTFNSHSIESRLHHVPGLCEHFLYFNDDMFLGRPVRPEQFFTPNGLARFFESEARVPMGASLGGLAVDTAARRGRDLLEAEFDVTVTHKLHHAPYALRRSVMADVEERFPGVASATTRSRFRHPDDLSIPSAFAHHYGFVTGRSVPGHLHVGYENIGGHRLGMFIERTRLGRDFDAFCLNETERWDVDPTRAANRVQRFLDEYFPLPSPWER